MNPSEGIFVYEVAAEQEGEHDYYVSPLSHEYGFDVGLRPEAIMGKLTAGPENMTPENFKQNSVFAHFLAWVINKHAFECPGLIAEAKRQQNGFVYIVDQRTPTPDVEVPPEDIIGGMEIENGEMLRFHSSPNYRVFTDDGFMQLDRWLRDRLIEELVALSGTPTVEPPFDE